MIPSFLAVRKSVIHLNVDQVFIYVYIFCISIREVILTLVNQEKDMWDMYLLDKLCNGEHVSDLLSYCSFVLLTCTDTSRFALNLYALHQFMSFDKSCTWTYFKNVRQHTRTFYTDRTGNN